MMSANPRTVRKRVLQVSFVVKDVYESIRAFGELCGIGPWFVFEHVPMKELMYRGSPVTMDFTVAAAYSGSMMFELIQQHDEVPSAYRDVVAMRGYGFHHLAISSDAYEQDLARLRMLGFAIANEGTSPVDHGGGRAAYIDTTARLPGMIELLEVVPELTDALSELEAAAANWDGRDPIRVRRFR
jgi:hypothetical protein